MSLEEWLREYECATANEKIAMRDFRWVLNLSLRPSLSPFYPPKNDTQDEYVSRYGKELSQYAFKKKIEEDIGPMLTLKLKGELGLSYHHYAFGKKTRKGKRNNKKEKKGEVEKKDEVDVEKEDVVYVCVTTVTYYGMRGQYATWTSTAEVHRGAFPFHC